MILSCSSLQPLLQEALAARLLHASLAHSELSLSVVSLIGLSQSPLRAEHGAGHRGMAGKQMCE